MQRRSFLAAIAALPVFGLFKKAPRDLSMWTDYPVKLTEPITLDPFIEVDLDNGPVTIGDITFTISEFWTVSRTSVAPTKESIDKPRDILKSNICGTVDIIWGPELLNKWVKVDQKGSDCRHLIPLSVENHSRSEFVDETNKQYGSLPKKFYHIKYENTSNLWAQIGLVDLRSSHET